MSFQKGIPVCYRCGGIAFTTKGVIYVKAEVKGEWGTYPVCDNCWYDGENKEPFRVKAEVFKLV